MTSPVQLLKFDEVAERLAVSRKTVERLAKRREIRVRYVGSSPRVTEHDLAMYVTTLPVVKP